MDHAITRTAIVVTKGFLKFFIRASLHHNHNRIGPKDLLDLSELPDYLTSIEEKGIQGLARHVLPTRFHCARRLQPRNNANPFQASNPFSAACHSKAAHR